jgi:transposase InsO family protein
MATGAQAFAYQKQFYGPVKLHQSDGGSEFQTLFVEAVTASGSAHRYSRPYKKNEQSHIENFNKALRNECFPRGEYGEVDIPKLQAQANEFTKHYIARRWHMGLPDMRTPQQFKEYYATDPEAATLAVAKVLEKSRLG